MITVLQPGMLTTVQDLGRVGYQAFGVPAAGVMDEYSARCANLLVGNEENAALLELTMLGGSYSFARDALIAVTGAQMEARINDKPIANWRSYKIDAGDVLSFSFASAGCRAYLAVSGGIEVKKVMGSASTHTRSKLGGWQGRALQKDDFLPVGVASSDKERILTEELHSVFDNTPCIRVLPGPQEKAFEAASLAVLQKGEYEIQADSDRMGYRLSGAVIKHKQNADIISDALFKGAVQVPGNGQPIIMLADCQTTGGYTKLCFVLTGDLPVLAQCKPGDKLRFKVVDEDAAAHLYQQYQNRLAEVRKQLKIEKRQFFVTVNGLKYDVQLQTAER